ncbi:MAG: hypothetical protein FWG40_10175 [Peptococcaceae bacterium]|nr:hypothetical protein [Peptococcaceae bacterium]
MSSLSFLSEEHEVKAGIIRAMIRTVINFMSFVPGRLLFSIIIYPFEEFRRERRGKRGGEEGLGKRAWRRAQVMS